VTRTLFTGGTIVTFDGAPATSLVIDDDRIVAVGHDADPRDVGYDEVVRLDRRCLLPAFRDAHAHPLHAGINRLELDLSDVSTLTGVQQAVRAWHTAHPGTEWIVGRGYDPTILPHSIGRAEWLDAACPDRPVALIPSDAHSVWVNTAALRAAGIVAGTPDPPLGAIARGADGSPIGQLLEFGGVDLVRPFFPIVTEHVARSGLLEAMHAMGAEGIVWAQDASITPDELDTYLAGAVDGVATCCINVAFRVDPVEWPRQRDAFVAGRARAAAAPAGQVTANTVKFFADGVIESGTGFLLEPYADCTPDTVHRCGLPNWSPAGLAEAVRAFDADGFQIHVHAIGDGGVRMSLDAIEHAQRLNGPRDRRPVIAHTQLVHPDDRSRFARLGVIANFEPLWAAYDEFMEQLALPRLGPARTALQYPIGSILDAGARVSFGSDWPVSSHRPLEGLAVAVTRQNRRGEPIGGWVPEERIPMLAAIRAYTEGSAFQAFDDDAGRLAVGCRADLVIADRDVTAIGGEELGGVAVDETWLAGRRVFTRSG
jgi:predicted amidohydrolase YtcJ